MSRPDKKDPGYARRARLKNRPKLSDERDRRIAQLEADLKRHENKIRHYPDSYLGKIFFQGVEQGRKQLEAENERLRAKLWWTQTAPPLRAEEIPVDVVEKYRQYLVILGGEGCIRS